MESPFGQSVPNVPPIIMDVVSANQQKSGYHDPMYAHCLQLGFLFIKLQILATGCDWKLKTTRFENSRAQELPDYTSFFLKH